MLLFIVLALICFVDSNAFNSTSATWTQSTVKPNDWEQIASDSSGLHLAAVSYTYGNQETGVYVSNDGGKTWSNVFISAPIGLAWRSIAVDPSGTTIRALQESSGMYTSYNGGKSWTRTTIDPTVYTDVPWNSMAVSGSYYIYVTMNAFGPIYLSSNMGSSFTKLTNSPPNQQFHYITTCQSGQYAAAFSHDVYVTTNYGSSWTKASAPTQYWYTAHYSLDGKYAVAVAAGGVDSTIPYGGVYVSSNYGQSWTVSPSVDRYIPWKAVTCDSTCTNIVAAVSSGDVYSSNDQGKTFVKSSTAPSGEHWYGISCDATNSKCALVSYNEGHIYYSVNGV